jgi:hypothetical protein
VEVPLTESHWEAAYLAGHDGISLARGWDRQLDTLYGAIFYRPTLSPSAYRAWLVENRVFYVALPDAPLDSAGRLEGKLVAGGLPYLHELWHSAHWRLFAVDFIPSMTDSVSAASSLEEPVGGAAGAAGGAARHITPRARCVAKDERSRARFRCAYAHHGEAGV